MTRLEQCIDCNAVMNEQLMTQEFEFGKDKIILRATFPVFHCAECDASFFDERGEIARGNASCPDNGLLSRS